MSIRFGKSHQPAAIGRDEPPARPTQWSQSQPQYPDEPRAEDFADEPAPRPRNVHRPRPRADVEYAQEYAQPRPPAMRQQQAPRQWMNRRSVAILLTGATLIALCAGVYLLSNAANMVQAVVAFCIASTMAGLASVATTASIAREVTP